MTEQQNERRRDTRVTFQTFVRLSYSEGRIFEECETKDISVSGVFVEGVAGVKQGEKCDVNVYLTGRTSSLVLEMSGETVRVGDGGVALQFFDVDEDSFYHLQNLVYFNYKKSGGAGEIVRPEDIDDETLYLGLNGGEKKSLPDNYLDEVDEEDDIDADEDDDVYASYKNRVDEDDPDS